MRRNSNEHRRPKYKSLSGRRGTGGIAFDFGDGGASAYSKTSGILSSVGRVGTAVALGALVLIAVLLRRDAADVALLAKSGVLADAAAGGEAGDDNPKISTKTSFRGSSAAATSTSTDYITLKTPHGNIRINLRPDLSSESVDYVRRIVSSKSCSTDSCRLYRAEKPGILQGILKSGADAQPLIAPNNVFGTCPEEYKTVKQDCPPHDPNCGCHGPVMVHGMVGWAAGTAGGPDFFINTHEKPAKHWGNQHTVWGEIRDVRSLNVVESAYHLPVHKAGMMMLDEKVEFSIELF